MTTPDSQYIEWVKLDRDTLLVASDRLAWIETDAASAAKLSESVMAGPGSTSSTRKLLDGAIGAAFAYADPAPLPELTATRWAYRLAGMYHLTRSTPALMTRAAEKFAEQHRTLLAG